MPTMGDLDSELEKLYKDFVYTVYLDCLRELASLCTGTTKHTRLDSDGSPKLEQCVSAQDATTSLSVG